MSSAGVRRSRRRAALSGLAALALLVPLAACESGGGGTPHPVPSEPSVARLAPPLRIPHECCTDAKKVERALRNW